MWEMILPVLLMRGQYLQEVVLQNEKPLSHGADPSLLGLGGVTRKGVEWPEKWAASVQEEPSFCVKNSVIGCWLSRRGREGPIDSPKVEKEEV